MTKAATPTMVQVEELTDRAASLKEQTEQLEQQEQDLSQQIAKVHASGGTKGKRLAALTQERREVREQRADILEALPLLRDQIAQDREAACRAEAVKRTTGIRQAHESLRAELDADEAAATKAAAAYKVAVNRVNDRYKALVLLTAEAQALSHRFDVAVPSLTPVALPALRAECQEAARTVQTSFVDHVHVRAVIEKCEHGLRQRRSYEEVASTPSGEILNAAGPKPFPPLSERQQETVASRSRAKEAEVAAAARFAGEAAHTVQRRAL